MGATTPLHVYIRILCVFCTHRHVRGGGNGCELQLGGQVLAQWRADSRRSRMWWRLLGTGGSSMRRTQCDDLTLPSKRLINPCAQESLGVFSPQVEFLPPPRPSLSTLLGWNSYFPLITGCSFMSAPSVLRGQINTNWLGVLFQRRLLGGRGLHAEKTAVCSRETSGLYDNRVIILL